MNDRKGSENAMAEGKEYISCPDELGSIHISEDVLAVTAAAAALEVEGVSSLTNPSKKNSTRGIHVKLEEEQVVLVPGTAFGEFGEGYVRLSYAASMDSLEQGFDRIAAFMERCHG